jgi:hypothetical protein
MKLKFVEGFLDCVWIGGSSAISWRGVESLRGAWLTFVKCCKGFLCKGGGESERQHCCGGD